MKSAKEMFDELGYKRFENDYWVYYSKETNSSYFASRVTFIKNEKTFGIEKFSANGILTKNITVKELQAIIQQCKELGWLDE